MEAIDEVMEQTRSPAYVVGGDAGRHDGFDGDGASDERRRPDNRGSGSEHFDTREIECGTDGMHAQTVPCDVRGRTGGIAMLTRLPQPEPLADVLAGPAWARTWAEAIVSYWETEHACGTIDVREPLYLFDLAPGRGVLAWLLLQAIEAYLSTRTLAPLTLRYLACCADDAALARMKGNPRLASYLETGVVEPLRWQAGEPVLPPSGVAAGARIPDAPTVNPIVVLAAGAFGQYEAQLCAAHDGQWLHGEVSLAAPDPDAGGDALGLAYTWRPAAPAALGACWAPLAERYRTDLVSAPLTIPTGAAAAVDALEALSGHRLLLLGCDIGITSEGAIREGGLAPPDRWEAGVSLVPVNFHALRWYQRAAWVCQREEDACRLVLHVAWSRAGEDVPSHAQRAMHRVLDEWAPFAAPHLARSASILAASAPGATLLSLLRTASYDPSVLRAILASCPDGRPQLNRESIPLWRDALREAWRHHVPAGLPSAGDTTFELGLAVFAASLGAWGLAKEVLRAILPITRDVLSVRRHLGYCLACTGAFEQARTEVEEARALAPNDEWCLAVREQFARRADRWRALRWYDPLLARDGGLTLEPLGVEHAQAYFACYTDPQVAAMANLPALRDIDETVAWIEEDAADTGRMSCAIVDADRGFVGGVGLSRAGTAAYFHFWLGAQAQGHGIGPRAARRLFALAEASGVDAFFTAAYASNGRSLRALMRLGFRQLPVQAEGEPDAVFFYRPASRDGARANDMHHAVARLAQLCRAIDAPGNFVPTASGDRSCEERQTSGSCRP